MGKKTMKNLKKKQNKKLGMKNEKQDIFLRDNIQTEKKRKYI